MTNKYEKMTYLLAIKEMQTEMRHHFPPMRMTKTKTRKSQEIWELAFREGDWRSFKGFTDTMNHVTDFRSQAKDKTNIENPRKKRKQTLDSSQTITQPRKGK